MSRVDEQLLNHFYGTDWSELAGNVSMLATEENRFWVAFYDGFVSRACVPLFMIASAFLLVPDRQTRQPRAWLEMVGGVRTQVALGGAAREVLRLIFNHIRN